MNILYLGCHEILEFLEIGLFTGMGHQVFSLGGAYQNENRGASLRGEIPNFRVVEELIPKAQTKEAIHPDLIEWADIVFMTHNVPDKDHPQPWLAKNWDLLKKSKKPVIWRSIGQSAGDIEKSLDRFRKEGLHIVRYSPREDRIPHYQGADAIIRFHIDQQEFDGYSGQNPRLVNISQSLFGGPSPSRGDHMNLSEFKQIVNGFDWKVFGPDNQNAGEHDGGVLNYEDMKSMLRFNRAYIYTGTRPASYTLAFMDALMTGIPVIAIGPKLADQLYQMDTYEVHEIIGTPGEAGFWSNDVTELRNYCKMLLENPDLARTVGSNGRLRAIELFGKDAIREQWKTFFDSLK